jgi:hypothetical protein
MDKVHDNLCSYKVHHYLAGKCNCDVIEAIIAREAEKSQLTLQRAYDQGRAVTVRERKGSHTFSLVKNIDVSGLNGTGVVALGVEFPDGTAVLRWLGKYPTTTIHGMGRLSVEAIDGHEGTTWIEWDS